MFGLENYLNAIPPFWMVVGIILAIGLSVIFIRGLIHLLIRAFMIGVVGLILLGAVYFVLNFLNITL